VRRLDLNYRLALTYVRLTYVLDFMTALIFMTALAYVHLTYADLILGNHAQHGKDPKTTLNRRGLPARRKPV
jgi:hypothetical protein